MEHDHRPRTVSSYVTQMSLVKNCPSHIKGAYKSADLRVLVFSDDDTDYEGGEAA